MKQDGGRRDKIGEFLEIFMPVLELDWRVRNMKAQKLTPRFLATVSGWALGPLTQKWNRRVSEGLRVEIEKEGGVDGNRREEQNRPLMTTPPIFPKYWLSNI